MTIEGAPEGPESKRPLAKCAEHGLHFDPTKHSGCVVCRRSASPPPKSAPPPPIISLPEISLPELSLPELPVAPAPALQASPAPLLVANAARPSWVPIGLALGGVIACGLVYYSVRLALLSLGVGTVAHTTSDGTITLRAPASWQESDNASSKPEKLSVILWHHEQDVVDTMQFSSAKLDEPLAGPLADQMPEIKASLEKTARCMSVQPATVAGTPGFQTVCTEKAEGEQRIAFHLFASSRMYIHHFAVYTNSLDTSPLQRGPLKWVAEAKLNVEP